MLNKRLTLTVGLVDRDGGQVPPSTVIRATSVALSVHGFDGFTVTQHVGYWCGAEEASLSFTILYDSELRPGFLPQELAAELADLFNQEAVLYSLETVWAELITCSGGVIA